MKSVFLKDVRPKDEFRCSFMVRSKELVTAKNGKPYLALSLSDKTGTADARVWEGADSLSAIFKEGDVVAVWGKAQNFQGRLQLILEDLVKVPDEEVDLSQYFPTSDVDLESCYVELVSIFESLENPWVRTVSLSLLRDPEISRRYKLCPAAKTIHHAFLGGLLVHSLQLVKVALSMLPFYPQLNRDLVLFGAAFHDFGKIFELEFSRGFQYSDEGRLVGHITIAACLLDRKIREIPSFPSIIESHLKHLILAHHGKLEFGSPKRPATLEAQFVHHLDDLDSKMDSIESHLKTQTNESGWSTYHKAYDQYYLRTKLPGSDETLH